MDQKPSDALTKRPNRLRLAGLIAVGVLVVGAGGVGTVALAQTFNPPAEEVQAADEPTEPPNVAPLASFSVLTVDGLTITVDGANSSDIDGELVAFSWAFGDGQTAEGPTASHTYTDYGTYTVTLTVTDDSGATAEFSTNITMDAPPPPPEPETPSGPTYGNYPPGYPVPNAPGTDSLDASACASKTAVETSSGTVCA